MGSVQGELKLQRLLNLVSSFKKKSSASNAADESSGGEDPSSWNMGQDDSAVHGKHLPPSPRRQLNKSSLKMVKTAPAAGPGSALQASNTSQLHQPNSGRRPGDRHSFSPLMTHKVTPASSPTYPSRARTTSESLPGLEPPQAPNPSASTSILRRKVLSKETVKQYQEKALQRQASRGPQEEGRARTGQAALHVPWEKEVSKDGTGPGLRPGLDRGLLEEIDSACCLGSASGETRNHSQEQQ